MTDLKTLGRLLRFEVPSREALDRLAVEPLGDVLRTSPARTQFHRDIYFDTLTGDLERRGVTARLRVHPDGNRTLSVDVREREQDGGQQLRSYSVSGVPTSDLSEIFNGDSQPARLLRAMLEPSRLVVQLELETARRRRTAHPDGDQSMRLELDVDAVTLRHEDIAAEFYELQIRIPEGEVPGLDAAVRHLEEQFGVRVTFASKIARAREVLNSVEIHGLEQAIQGAREVAVLALRDGRVALLRDQDSLRVPVGQGWGEKACRQVLRRYFGRSQGSARLIGTNHGFGTRPAVEVWLVQRITQDDGADGTEIEWIPLDEVLTLAGSVVVRDASTLTALNTAARTHVLAISNGTLSAPRQAPIENPFQMIPPLAEALPTVGLADSPAVGVEFDRPAPDTLLNMEVSELAFQERVLALAADERTPLLERVRFISILGSNLDQFFMTRVAGFHKQLASGSTKVTLDGLTADEQLQVIGVRVRQILDRTYHFLWHKLVPDLQEVGISLARWDDVDESDRSYLVDNYALQLAAVLTPLAFDPSHPFPHIRNLRPALAVVVRVPESQAEHFAAIELPGDLPRFVPLPGGRRFIPLEEVIRASLPTIYRGLEVVQAHVFRVTRSANLSIDDEAGDLLQAVQEKVLRRPLGPVVRLEVQDSMPEEMREILLRELQFEASENLSTLGAADVYPVDNLVDLFGLHEIADLPIPELHYPPLHRTSPLEPQRSVWEILRDREVLVQFPYDSFEATVERMLAEAAKDDKVLSIRITLYRTSRSSRVVKLLRRARRNGKEVLAVVELKASFDEQRNIEWARKLESAGIHVVYGPAHLKVHAKVMLIVRREDEGLRRYLYIGTGNLNAATAAAYTDLGLLTTGDGLGEEIQDVFHGLTGYSARTEFEHLLVAPFNMRERFVALIDREAEHARAGRGGHIRIKINGLTDLQIIAALYRASRAGVRCELIVRGLCALRPGVQGLSENISVISILGRFLEHSRIFRFENAGDPEYFIGSADWRPRNLSRRVEVVAPITDPSHRMAMDQILENSLANADAWVLMPDGSYRRPSFARVSEK